MITFKDIITVLFLVFIFIIVIIVNISKKHFNLKPIFITFINTLISTFIIYILFKKPINAFLQTIQDNIFNSLLEYFLKLIT